MHCHPEVPPPSGAGSLPECRPASGAGDEIAALRPIRAILGRTDYWRLNEHRRRYESLGSPLLLRLARLIRAKMLDATVVDPDQLPPDAVTGASLVTFAIGQRRETRLLYHFDYADHRRNQLHVGTFPGVTLIGMRVGQRMRLLDGSGVAAGEVRVLAVEPDSATGGPAFS